MTQKEAMEKIRGAGAGCKSGTLEAGIAEMLIKMGERNADTARLIAEDLDNPNMSIKAVAKMMTDYARKNKSGNSYYMAPEVAEDLIADFYKLPKALGSNTERSEHPTDDAPIDLFDLL